MSNKKHEARLKELLFQEQTTLKRDFRDIDLKSIIEPKYVERPKHEKKREKSNLKYLETCQEYKGDSVSFSLYIKPNAILGVNPRAVQKPFVPLVDEGRKEAQVSRPRLVISPGMSLDSIEDDKVRDMVLADIYETNKSIADRMAMAGVDRCPIKAPLGDTYALPKPIFLPIWRPPVAVPEWRMESRYWDRNNLRGYATPDEEFWLRRSSR